MNKTKSLKGGTLGDVRLVSGMAKTAGGRKLPYRFVLKTQKKWERPGDPDSWRREYDLYTSKFGAVFTEAFRWPKCYHAEIDGDRMHLWMEYIEGASGGKLTIEMLERAALEWGRFQGRLCNQPEALKGITCLSDAGFPEREFNQWHTQSFTYDFLISKKCSLPGFLKQMLRDGKIQLVDGKSFEYGLLRSEACDLPEHLRQMLIGIDDNQEAIFGQIKRLPVVLCHRDFWTENIFFVNGSIVSIDWDGAGWGCLGEDIASLVADADDCRHFEAYCRRLIPAYYQGISEHLDISAIGNFCVKEMILIKFGYRLLQKYMFTQSPGKRNQAMCMLQKIYEMEND